MDYLIMSNEDLEGLAASYSLLPASIRAGLTFEYYLIARRHAVEWQREFEVES